jgi:hypothetical protein
VQLHAPTASVSSDLPDVGKVSDDNQGEPIRLAQPAGTPASTVRYLGESRYATRRAATLDNNGN